MELVPFIESVLIKLAILAAVVITVSYIIFKIRQKKFPETVYVKQKQVQLEPNIINKSIRRITKITKEIIPLSPPKLPKQESKKVHKKTRAAQEAVKIAEKKKTKPQRPKRIEVVNNLIKNDENLNPQQPIVNKEIPKGELKFLGDDILDKYSDSEKHDLFTLKTKKPNQKD